MPDKTLSFIVHNVYGISRTTRRFFVEAVVTEPAEHKADERTHSEHVPVYYERGDTEEAIKAAYITAMTPLLYFEGVKPFTTDSVQELWDKHRPEVLDKVKRFPEHKAPA